jgi:hypothetical protein
VPFFTHEVVPSYPLREIDDVVSPISDLGACLRDIVNFGPGEACVKRPHGAGAYTEDFPQAIVLSDGPGHAREGGITMRDAFPAPASQMARFFRCFVIAVAGAQTAFWLYTFRLIYVNANPMGDGFEFVAVVPFGFVFFALVVPSLVSAQETRGASLILRPTTASLSSSSSTGAAAQTPSDRTRFSRIFSCWQMARVRSVSISRRSTLEADAVRADRSKNLCYGAKLSMRRTADQAPLRLAEKRGSGMGSNKKTRFFLCCCW